MIKRSLFYMIILGYAWLGSRSFSCETGTFESTERSGRQSLGIREWENATKLMRAGSVPLVPRESVPFENLAMGTIGYFEEYSAEVILISGPTDCVLILNHHTDQPIWLAEYPTSSLKTGDRVRLVGLAKIGGLRSVTMPISRTGTVYALSLMTEHQVDDYLMQTEEDSLYRNWSDPVTKKTVQARLVSVSNRAVHLQRKDNGSIIRVPFRRLSLDDQQFVQRTLDR